MSTSSDFIEGMVDSAGRPAKRSQSGYWRSASYIIGAGAAERFAYFGISSNMITYLTGPLGLSTAAAAASANTWIGAGSVLPILCACVADLYIGRSRTIVLSSLLYISALGLLTTSALSNSAPRLNILFFFASLYMIALGEGAFRSCIMAFGADQFDEQDPLELRGRSSFFNWWLFGTSAIPLVALLALNYVQDNISWAVGFGIPCISMAIALLMFLLGTKSYRYIITINNKYAHDEGLHDMSVPVLQSQQLKFLNKKMDGAEEMEAMDKKLVKLIPVWATCLAYATATAQISTLFIKQGISMDRSVGPRFDVPAAWLQYVMTVTIILLIPIYDRIFVPLARMITGTPSGITKLQRIGSGLCCCSFTMVVAALVERKRLEMASSPTVVPMKVWWLIPQYMLCGISDSLTLIGLQDLFYEKVSYGLKSVGLSLYPSIVGMGSFLSSLLICLIERITGEENGWFSDSSAHLDYFYWLLAGLNTAGFLVFLYLAKSFR